MILFLPFLLQLPFLRLPLLPLSATVLCPRGEAVLPRSCVNERGCQCCYLDYLQGAVSALNSTGPDTVSAAPSAATRLIQSVFGESALARCFSLLHTHIFTLSCQKAHREPLSLTANQFSANSFIDMTNVTSASPEQIWTSCVPRERRNIYLH